MHFSSFSFFWSSREGGTGRASARAPSSVPFDAQFDPRCYTLGVEFTGKRAAMLTEAVVPQRKFGRRLRSGTNLRAATAHYYREVEKAALPLAEKVRLLASLTRLLLDCMEREDREDQVDAKIAEATRLFQEHAKCCNRTAAQ